MWRVPSPLVEESPSREGKSPDLRHRLSCDSSSRLGGSLTDEAECDGPTSDPPVTGRQSGPGTPFRVRVLTEVERRTPEARTASDLTAASPEWGNRGSRRYPLKKTFSKSSGTLRQPRRTRVFETADDSPLRPDRPTRLGRTPRPLLIFYFVPSPAGLLTRRSTGDYAGR